MVGWVENNKKPEVSMKHGHLYGRVDAFSELILVNV